jgi:hypothetical protein
MLVAAPAAAVRATQVSSLVRRGTHGHRQGCVASPEMMMRTLTRPRVVTVRSAKTPALASRDRIAGTAIRASTRSPRPRRPSRARVHGAVAMAVEAVELDDERYDLDPADMFDEPTVSIPISFFSILNVTPARASPAAIEAAYAGVINRELVEGFSDGEFILVFVGEIRLTSCLFYRMPRRAGRSDRRSRAGPIRPGPPPRARRRRQERAPHPRPGVAARRRARAHAGGWRARVRDRIRA